jgi:hypothetical protein
LEEQPQATKSSLALPKSRLWHVIDIILNSNTPKKQERDKILLSNWRIQVASIAQFAI